MSTVKLDCPICNKEFNKPRNEYNRRKKLGRPIYCGLSCAGKANIKNIPLEKRIHPENLVADNRRDEYSPFRYYMKCLKNPGRKSCEVTVKDLKKQWDEQNGICPYTGWKMLIPKSSCYNHQVPHVPERASVDRIDSSKPYEPGNIQFVATIVQYAKHAWHKDEVFRFCEAVVQNQR